MRNNEQIMEVIQNSHLSNEDKLLLIDHFSRALETELEPILHLFKENILWVEKINNNLKRKKLALSMEDEKLWENILNEEGAQLDEMDSK